MNEIKLHIGCGTVYLQGYINIDANPDGLACVLPNIVETNKTTVENYYKFGFKDRPEIAVADLKATFFEIDDALFAKCSINFVDEICMFHVLEHFPQYEVDSVITKIYSLLKPHGKFRVAVPDFDNIILEYADKLKNGIKEEEKEWYFRFIHGTQKNKWSHHYCGYNKYRLIKMLEKHGFTSFENLPNQNFYPAVHVLAIK